MYILDTKCLIFCSQKCRHKSAGTNYSTQSLKSHVGQTHHGNRHLWRASARDVVRSVGFLVANGSVCCGPPGKQQIVVASRRVLLEVAQGHGVRGGHASKRVVWWLHAHVPVYACWVVREPTAVRRAIAQRNNRRLRVVAHRVLSDRLRAVSPNGL